ncbi:MAG TPA: acyl-CoA dehydrogenase family protein [Mycobacteriales bacterium]|nr:acyl-CoA dehydrogenase family protein [Mycobacteriales bacterium]
MDPTDLAAFTAAVRQAAQHHSADFDKGLEQVGWREALAEDPVAARTVFAVQGELNLSSSALDDVLLRALGHQPDPGTAVLIAPYPIGTRRLASAGHIISVDVDGVIPIPPGAPTLRAVHGIDPEGGWVELSGSFEVHVMGGCVPPPPRDAALAAGRLAVATELAAAARAMLDLACEHAISRVQFGKPIASFQAVRHRLADALIAVAAAEAAVDAGWEDTTPYTAAMAKAIAGRSSRAVARHAQQVLAGMGFTSEHTFHRYLRRVLALDQVLGSAAEVSAELGRTAIRDRKIPAMLSL